MRLHPSSLIVFCVFIGACDSQPDASQSLVGSWVTDSLGTITSVVPVTSQTVVNFASVATEGSVSFTGRVNVVLGYGSVDRMSSDGLQEAVFTDHIPTDGSPEAIPYYRMRVAGGPESSTRVTLNVQEATTSSRYEGFVDGPPFEVDGTRIVVPPAELEGFDGLPPLTFLGGSFDFPTLNLVAGESIVVRRRISANREERSARYVFEADGTYRIEAFSVTGPPNVSVIQSGTWEADGTELILQRTPENIPPTTLQYEVVGGYLSLLDVRGCSSANSECARSGEALLSLPPGSIESYATATATILRR